MAMACLARRRYGVRMTGQHRSLDRHPVRSVVKSARWMVMLGAIVAVPAALLAAAVYLIFFGTGPERWAVAAAGWAILLAGAVVRVVRRLAG